MEARLRVGSVLNRSRRTVLRHSATAMAGGGAFLAAACGADRNRVGGLTASPSQPRITLELFGAGTPDTESQTRELLKPFLEKHPTIKVNSDYLQNGKPYREKLKVLVTSDTPPDVFYLEWFVYPPYVVGGHLAEIDRLAKKDRVGVDDLWPSFRRQFTWQGKLWALAQGMQTMVTWYNVDFFQQAGLPPPRFDWTWDDLLAAARRLTVVQGSEVQRFGVTYWQALHQPPGAFIYMNGGRLFDRDENPTTCLFHEPAAREALQWLADLRVKHRVAPTSAVQDERGGNSSASTNIFATGGAAMNMRNVPLDLWQRIMTDYRWSAAPLPRGKAGQFSMSLSHSKVMAKRSPHRDAAWALLRWIGGPEAQALAARSFSTLPCYRSVAEQDYLPQPEMAGIKQTVLTSLAQGKWFPNTDKISDALDIINPTFGKMFDGQVAVSDGVQHLRTQVASLLAGG